MGIWAPDEKGMEDSPPIEHKHISVFLIFWFSWENFLR